METGCGGLLLLDGRALKHAAADVKAQLGKAKDTAEKADTRTWQEWKWRRHLEIQARPQL